jgi:peptidoglycan/xylan/chitin deacetylase (PgdA/CDA1 family)
VQPRVRPLVARAIKSLANIRRRLDPADSAIALTFDDGPDPVSTVAVLDELARLEISATFFLVCEHARAHPDVVRRIVADGHAVGSHSFSHPDPWRLATRDLVREYRRGRALVEDAAQVAVPLFRPPKGYVDARGVLAMLATRVRPWLWTVDPGDWEPDVTPEHIVEECSAIQAGDIVLLHDAIRRPLAPSALDRSATCAALPFIASLARDRNLRFVTLG